MITETIKELEAAKAQLAELEAAASKQSAAALAALPAEYGFSTMDEFIAALKEAAGRRGRSRKAGKPGRKPTAAKATRRKRGKITPEIKEQVKTMVAAGKTGAAIAKSVGISLPSVQNIKKELGLVKARGK